MPRKRIGKEVLNKIVPVKVDRENFYRLRKAQMNAKRLIDGGERLEEDMEELATCLRKKLYNYIDELESFVNDGVGMISDKDDDEKK